MTDMLKKVPVKEQDPKVRAANFEEVCLGYTKEEVKRPYIAVVNSWNEYNPGHVHLREIA